MRTYVAVLVHVAEAEAEAKAEVEAEAEAASGRRAPLYRESFVLLTARSEDEARSKARAHGASMETSYRNERGEPVTWTLRQLVDVAEVPDDRLGDGAELYTRHFRDFAAYTAFEPLLSGEDL
ncbi:DUF4288 domain-containing protein [Streptomyces vinaceus]|uniref:DUF4288 domain-containing protein n=1 Tax=Streptomyces vinaceus TaxID=1960 RepID=UPI0036B304E2